MTTLTADLATSFARLTLGHVGRLYPYKPDHMIEGPEDVRAPAEVHPIFHGSFDWHSCVHSWWQLLTIARLFPDTGEAAAIRARADMMLVPEKAAGELAYVQRPSARGFSRPYGRAWLLTLHAEADRHAGAWGAALEPLARDIAGGFRDYLTLLTYPIRVGTHPNSAFAMVHILRWAEIYDPALAALVRGRALGWYAADRDAQAWEPSGDDFLSGTLCEALLMSELLDSRAFAEWFDRFLPGARNGLPATLFTPAIVSDRSDGKIAHLDGLNLSRAWCWRRIAAALGEGHALNESAREAAGRHLAAALPHIAGDYMGEHWLATFALLALLA